MQVRKASIADQANLEKLNLDFELTASAALSHQLQFIRKYKDRDKAIAEIARKFLVK